MRILMLAQHYAPEEVSGAVLATELAEDLAKRGHLVTFLTGAPSYPYGKIYSGYANPLYSAETNNNVRIIRTWSYISPGKGSLPRLLNYVSFSIATFLAGLRVGKPDVIFCYSPPLPLGLSAWMLSSIWQVPWIFRVEDLYPEAATATGVLRNPAVIAILIRLERFLYRRATHISLISNGFKHNLLAKGVTADKLSVEPLWADIEHIYPQEKENEFRREQNLTGKFILGYAGNIGLTSALEDVLQAAELLQSHPDIHFVLVGEGSKKDALIQYSLDRDLKNVHFLPYQPRPAYALLLPPDLNLVSLNPESAKYSLPNKLFNLMASGRPILEITPLDSEIAQIIETAKCGTCVPPHEAELLANMILALKDNCELLQTLGSNGRRHVERYFARDVCIDQYETMIRGAVG
jgi:colanic acid biosynthesis glycosyl transferase WcaI